MTPVEAIAKRLAWDEGTDVAERHRRAAYQAMRALSAAGWDVVKIEYALRGHEAERPQGRDAQPAGLPERPQGGAR